MHCKDRNECDGLVFCACSCERCLSVNASDNRKLCEAVERELRKNKLTQEGNFKAGLAKMAESGI